MWHLRVRIPGELREPLKKVADASDRSVNEQIARFIREGIERAQASQ